MPVPPKVSIIMGVYNCEKTLCEAIDSILNQTFQDWEFIICDDGSSDRSVEILQHYAQRYPEKFVLLKNDSNRGLNETLNTCLSCARGKYVARMDGDDTCTPDRLEREYQFLESHEEYAFVSGFMSLFDESGVWGVVKHKECPSKEDLIKHSPCFCHAPCMILRSAYLDVGGYTVDRRLLRYEDCNLWCKLYGHGYLGYNIQDVIYSMRDDHNAYRRRTFASRMQAVYVAYVDMKELHASSGYYLLLIPKFFTNLVKAVVPEWIYMAIHRRRLQR